MRFQSLAFRLAAAAAAASAIGLIVAGAVLYSVYARAVERNFDERLELYLTLLVANAVEEDGSVHDPGSLGDPRFGLPLSGWYWRIAPLSELTAPSLVSPSLFGSTLAVPVDPKGSSGLVRYGDTDGPEGARLRLVEREIETSHGRFSFAVAGPVSEIQGESAGFIRNLVGTLGLFAALLVAVVAVQVRFGLQPLERMRQALAEVRAGRAQELSGEFPQEIRPLAAELNALLRGNRELVERARTHVGNLAHALKTPLSVILNEARAREPDLAKVAEQARLMGERVQHELDRARMAASAGAVGVATEIGPVVEALARTLGRIHGDRSIELEAATEPGVVFRGERQDLEEVVGNLLDNACKWASRKVTVTAAAEPDSADGRRWWRLAIEDDGPGLDEAARAEALRRGGRLDETKPGSGLGLSIVSDLVGAYGGTLTLSRASLGGLRADVRLPAV